MPRTKNTNFVPHSALLFIAGYLSFVTTGYAQVTDVFSLEGLIYSIIARVAILLWVLAVAAFFWGVVKFIKNADDPGAREEGKQLMIWGIIAFVVLVSLWALVAFVLNSVGLPSVLPRYRDKNGNVVLELPQPQQFHRIG